MENPTSRPRQSLHWPSTVYALRRRPKQIATPVHAARPGVDVFEALLIASQHPRGLKQSPGRASVKLEYSVSAPAGLETKASRQTVTWLFRTDR